MIETAQNSHRDIASQSPRAIYGQVRLAIGKHTNSGPT